MQTLAAPTPKLRSLALFGLVTLLLALPLPLRLPSSVGIVGAERILAGDLPYRDFWTVYAPGQFYLLALLLWLARGQLVVAALAAILCTAASTLVIDRLARQSGIASRRAFWLALLFGLLFWRAGPALTTYEPALLLLLVAGSILLEHLHQPDPRRLWRAGLCFGLAACFKHDVSAYALLGCLPALWLRGSTWRERLLDSVRIGSGASLPVVLVAAWLAFAAGPDALHDLLVFPATDFAASRPEAFPGLVPPLAFAQGRLLGLRALADWGVLNLPLYVFGAGLFLLVRRWQRLSPASRSLLALPLGMLPWFWLAAHVQINTHVYTMATLCLLFLGSARERVLAWPPGTRRTLLHGSLLVLALLLLALPARFGVRLLQRWPVERSLEFPGLAGLRVTDQEWRSYAPVIEFVRQQTRPEERIYVGVQRHDAVVISRFMLYSLTGRRGCSRHDELHPGVVDRADVQQEIIRSLKEHRVRCVVLWKVGWSDQRFDEIKARRQQALPDTGATDLDRFLAEQYEEVARHGELRILWRDL